MTTAKVLTRPLGTDGGGEHPYCSHCGNGLPEDYAQYAWGLSCPYCESSLIGKSHSQYEEIK